MDPIKRKKLEAAGWKVGSVADMLQLTPEQEQLVAFRVQLSKVIREKRQEKAISQARLAEIVQSSQSRVAKMEKADAGITIDLLLRTAFALGVNTGNLFSARERVFALHKSQAVSVESAALAYTYSRTAQTSPMSLCDRVFELAY